MTLTLTILGCGSSAGVPRPALGWGACDPGNPKNHRRRCSLLAERAGEGGIIAAGYRIIDIERSDRMKIVEWINEA